MRASLLLMLVPVTLACAKGDDTAARDTTPAAAAQPSTPAALTPAGVTGTWTGRSMTQESDTVVLRWTMVHTTDSTGWFKAEGIKDSIPYRVQFSGDSMVMTSEPYASPAAPRGPRHVFRSTGRLQGDRLVGTVMNVLATNPDSVVARGRWEATRSR